MTNPKTYTYAITGNQAVSDAEARSIIYNRTWAEPAAVAITDARIQTIIHLAAVSTVLSSGAQYYMSSYAGATRPWEYAGRIWLCYRNSDGTIYFTSTTDFTSWAAGATTGLVQVAGSYNDYDGWATFFDGIYLHVAVLDGSAGVLYYRRGTPASDGSIAFAAIQTVDSSNIPTGANAGYMSCIISVDLARHVWIGYSVGFVGGGSSYFFVSRNSRTDGTWTTDTGFPYQPRASFVGNNFDGTYPIPLSTGDVLVFTLREGEASMQAKLWHSSDGTWGAVENTPGSANYFRGAKGTAIEKQHGSDTVHVVGINNSSYHALYFKRTVDGTWTGPVDLGANNGGDYNLPRICIDDQDTIRILFYNNPKIKQYISTDGGANWTGETDWSVSLSYYPTTGANATGAEACATYATGPNSSYLCFAYVGYTGSAYALACLYVKVPYIDRNVLEILSDSDAWSRSIAPFATTRTFSDTLADQDAIVRFIQALRTDSETVAITDAESRTRIVPPTIAEPTLSVTDATTRVKQIPRTSAEPTLASTDSFTKLRTILATISDPALNVSDAITLFKAIGRTITDALGITDAESRFYQANRSIAEPTVASSDTVTKLRTILVTLTDTLASTDLFTALRTILASIAETPLSVSDAESRLNQAFRSIDEPLTVADAFSPFKGLVRTITEAIVGVTDSESRFYQANRDVDEPALTLSDLESRFYQANRSVDEIPLSVGDMLSALRTILENIFEDPVAVSDAESRFYQAIRSVDEPELAASDTLSPLRTVLAAWGDALTSVDAFVAGALTRLIVEPLVAIYDAIVRAIFPTITGDVRLDGVQPPHVIGVEVVEGANIDTRGVNQGLPEREFKGHKGRAVKVTGWLATLADLDGIAAMQDGALHTLLLPTGDSFDARIVTLTPKPDVATPYDTVYMVELHEAEANDA